MGNLTRECAQYANFVYEDHKEKHPSALLSLKGTVYRVYMGGGGKNRFLAETLFTVKPILSATEIKNKNIKVNRTPDDTCSSEPNVKSGNSLLKHTFLYKSFSILYSYMFY